ncbi:MAG: alpha/beta hydrolase [Clostridia bacterium]|nr:alpha/beta hydrolase [Clostridia bacterium]
MAIITLPHNPTLTGLLDQRANIPYLTVDGETLCLQLVKPQWESPEKKGFPLVLFIQGSGWTQPNQFWELPQLSLLAAQGYVIASVTHRSCYTAPAPAFLRDVKAALRFLRKNAAEYDIDPARVCAFGTSSGGNTALLLGVTADDPAFETDDYAGESTRVQCVVDCFGPTDMDAMVDAWDSADPEEDNLLFNLGGKDRASFRRNLAAIDPMRYVEPGMTLPPFLILHGDADTLVSFDHSQRMYDRLTGCGCEADLVRVEGAPHEGSFWSLPLLQITFDFIRKHLG